MVAALQVGDEVMTAGGILGRITGVSDHYAVVQISDNTEIKIQKASVSQVVPKGTFEEA
jgi:preprotein translocase subunit YajC